MHLSTPGAHLPPAAILKRAYAPELQQLGAVDTKVTGMQQLTVTFKNAWDARYASETLRNVVDGIQMLYTTAGNGATPDIVSQPTGQASFVNRLDAITGYTISHEHPMSPVAFHLAPGADRAKLVALIAPTFQGTRTKVVYAGG